MIMRFGSSIDDLYVLEAVGEFGVRLVSWHQVRFYLGSFFNQISYRKLFHTIETKELKSLDEFRKNAVGKQYSVGVKKFFTTKSEAPS